MPIRSCPARLQSGDRFHRGRSAPLRRRIERTGGSRDRPSAPVAAVRRTRFFAPAAGQEIEAADFPDPSVVEASRSRTEVIVGFVRQEQPTLRQLLASSPVRAAISPLKARPSRPPI